MILTKIPLKMYLNKALNGIRNFKKKGVKTFTPGDNIE